MWALQPSVFHVILMFISCFISSAFQAVFAIKMVRWKKVLTGEACRWGNGGTRVMNKLQIGAVTWSRAKISENLNDHSLMQKWELPCICFVVKASCDIAMATVLSRWRRAHYESKVRPLVLKVPASMSRADPCTIMDDLCRCNIVKK